MDLCEHGNKLLDTIKAGNFLTSWVSTSNTLHHGVNGKWTTKLQKLSEQLQNKVQTVL